MKHIRFFSILLLTLSFLSACGSSEQNEWKIYRAKKGSLVNSDFPAYSFEYPSGWELQEAANHITFASEAKLLKEVPETLKSGQIIAELSLNVNMSPEEMVNTYGSTLDGLVQFTDVVPFLVNGRAAAYQEGTNSQTGDRTFIVAVDIGENMRGLLTARTPQGELELGKDTLMKMAESLQVEK